MCVWAESVSDKMAKLGPTEEHVTHVLVLKTAFQLLAGIFSAFRLSRSTLPQEPATLVRQTTRGAVAKRR